MNKENNEDEKFLKFLMLRILELNGEFPKAL